MRKLHQPLLALLILALTLTGAGFGSATPPVAAQQQYLPDAEIAYINANTAIQIVDPFQAPGTVPFPWTSTTSGYSDFAPLDANGDSIDEIVAISGNTARILAPYTPAGATAPAWENTIPAGFVYISVWAGDVMPNDNGRDEIIVQRTDNRNGAGYSLQVYRANNAAGTQWQLALDESFGAPWLRIKTGEYTGLAGEEMIMIRRGLPGLEDYRIKVMSYDLGSFQTFTENNAYCCPWVDVAVGNTHTNNGNLTEMVLTRDGALAERASMVILQNAGSNRLADAPGGQKTAFPHFTDIAVGDTNASGDDEVFLVRDPLEGGSGISMIGLNYGTDTFPADWERGLQLGRNLKAIEMGDVDGDGRAEVVVAQPGSYRIWLEPASSLTSSTDWITAAFRDPIAMRLGNFDGNGINATPPRLAVDKTSLSFNMVRGQANPPNQTFQVTNAGGGGAIAYSVTKQNGSAWLQVDPFDGATPRTHTVSINGAGLAANVYQDTIIITAQTAGVPGSPQRIDVRLTVTATGPELKVEPSSLTFTHNFGGNAPAPQNLAIRNIGDGGPQSYHLTLTTTDGGAWLQTNKTSGQSDDTVSVFINPTNLRPGAYSGNIRVDAGSIRGSPANVPITLNIAATGMVVTPSSLIMVAHTGQRSPLGQIHIDQSVAGQGAIHWYAYAVPSGDWWGLQNAAQGPANLSSKDGKLVLTSPTGVESELDTLPWVILTPNNGLTPGILQITFDMNQAPKGDSRVTILIDGGPGTPSRFQGVDLRVSVNVGGAWLPLIRKR